MWKWFGLQFWICLMPQLWGEGLAEVSVNCQFWSCMLLVCFEFWFCCWAYFYQVIWHSVYIPPSIAVLLVRTLQQVPMFGKSALLFSFQLLVWCYLHSSLEICRLVSNISLLSVNQVVILANITICWFRIKWLAVPYFPPVICHPPPFFVDNSFLVL